MAFASARATHYKVAMRFLLILMVLLTSFSLPARADQEGIAAVVNDDAISMTDLRERTKLIMISSGLPDTPEVRAKLLPQIMDSLIEEQLMIQEAKKDNITVSDADVEGGFNTLAAQNKIPADKFKAMIEGSGINIATMRRQIRAQIGWSKVIQKIMRPQITVTDGDIDDYLSHLTANKGNPEYLLAEILIPVSAPADDTSAHQVALKLVSEMRAGKAPFSKVAQQFSKAPGAAHGGDLGWLQQGQLAPELAAALPTMKPMDITDPIRTPEGYDIIMMRDKRVMTDENLPSRDQALSTIGVQRLDRAQRRYMMDLKSAAFIEKRVQS